MITSCRNFSPSSILLSHNAGWSGRLTFQQNSPPSAMAEFTEPRSVRDLVNQFHMRTKEPLHLVRDLPPHGAAIVVNTHTPLEVGQRTPEDEFEALGAYRFGADPRQDFRCGSLP